MNLHDKNPRSVDRSFLAEDLLRIALIDTVYRDLYLQRASHFLAPVLSEANYHDLRRLQTEAMNLPNRVRLSMEQKNWAEVKGLSARLASLKRTLAEKEGLLQLGKKIYELGEPPLDPFSPGLQELAGVDDLKLLLSKALALLKQMKTKDSDWNHFYAARMSTLAALETDSLQTPNEAADLSGSKLEHEALNALQNGNFGKLERLASLMEKDEPGQPQITAGRSKRLARKAPELLYDFPREVVDRAGGLGLAPIRMEAGSRGFNISLEELARLYRYIWQPTFTVTDQFSRGRGGRLNSDIPLPAGTPVALRDLVELFTIHPFVNSGGVRLLPSLVEEDVLVEDFADPDPGELPPPSALLSALGFDDRWGLSRLRLEKALLDQGNAVIRAIGLDEHIFRLVCIPPDVYWRIGFQKGWGLKSIWTHFDGYMVTQNGTLGPLAGGDVRFGGLYDLVGISRDYDSDRIMARFAVVQRRRMERGG